MKILAECCREVACYGVSFVAEHKAVSKSRPEVDIISKVQKKGCEMVYHIKKSMTAGCWIVSCDGLKHFNLSCSSIKTYSIENIPRPEKGGDPLKCLLAGIRSILHAVSIQIIHPLSRIDLTNNIR